jgi:hypothetical protein
MLWATGCSHTFGDDLKNKKNAWPYLLAKDLELGCINNAVSGGSNERIVYQTLKTKKKKIFVICWTYISRFTRYRSDNNYEVNFNVHTINDLFNKDYSFHEYTKLHYKHWYNELYSFKLWLQQIILLQNYLKQIEQPYLMLNSTQNNLNLWVCNKENFIGNVKEFINFDLMNDDQIFSEWQEIQRYYSLIDKKSFFDIENYFLTQYNSSYTIGKTKHLLEEGHKRIAKDLYKPCLKLIH